MSKTKIEWTEESWNPVIGCKKVSDGCRHCYAEKMSVRLSSMGNKCSPDYVDILKYNKSGKPFGFNGEIKTLPERLQQPLHWKKPRMIFVNSMSDLFHEDVPFNFIDKIFAIMWQAPQHIFQILTKRPERMYEYMNEDGEYLHKIVRNIWFGISVEDQETADERIPLLLKIPALVKWISAEPLLGEIDLTFITQFQHEDNEGSGVEAIKGIDWVIVGGESGPKARPMHPDWVRGIRDQCKAAGVPFFFKQWGAFIPSYNAGERLMEKGYYNKPIFQNAYRHCHYFEDGLSMVRVGKKKAGNLLNGKQYLEYPQIKVIS